MRESTEVTPLSRLLLPALLAAMAGCGVSAMPVSQSNSGGPGGGSGTAAVQSGAGSGSTAAAAGTTSGGAGGTGAGVSGSSQSGSPSGSGASASGIADASASVASSGGEGGGPSAALEAGSFISIGGNQVPQQKAIVFLHVGHSNMAGRASRPASLSSFNYSTDPHLWRYQTGGVWTPAMEPLCPDPMTGTSAGPGMSILHTALDMAPDAYIVSIGKGQTGDLAGYCRNFLKGGLFYSIVMDAAMELKGKVTFGAIWTMFGTSEFADMTHASTFGQCLAQVVTDMRTDLGEPNLPALIGDWEMGSTGMFLPTTAFAMSIIAQIHQAAAAIPAAQVIPTDGLEMENPDSDSQGGIHHYDFAGHKGWAERGFDLAYQAGWTPWATQPPLAADQ
jgi:hypothetical protein